MMRTTILLVASWVAWAQSPLGVADSGKRLAASTRLVIRNANLVDGSGTPANGPQTIVIEGNRIVAVSGFGTPSREGDRVIDAQGKYVLPGLINVHAHIHDERAGWPMRQEYQFKVWLASGITSVRDVGSNYERSKALREKSNQNETAAPRLFLYQVFTPNLAPSEANEQSIRARVRQIRDGGADGLKFFAISPWAMKVLLDECRKIGLRTAHHAAVAETNAWHDIEYGTTSIEHWYGVPDAALRDGAQDFPAAFNHQYEVDRFRYAGHLFRQTDPAKLRQVLRKMAEAKVAWSPTLGIYEAARDLLRYQNQPFFAEYLHPALEKFFAPDPNNHGSFFLNWTSGDEAEWRNNYRIWMQAVRDFERLGGLVGIGEDAGFIYNLYGFGQIRTMELHQEAGFHPLQVVRHATSNNAKIMGKEHELGFVRPGYLADLLVVDGNPLADFRMLYPQTAGVPQTGKILWTIKDGVPFHVPTVTADVKRIVAEDRKNPQPRQAMTRAGDEEAHEE